MAERVGFEPTLEFPLNTLSKRAPSTTRPPLLGMVVFLNLPRGDGSLHQWEVCVKSFTSAIRSGIVAP